MQFMLPTLVTEQFRRMRGPILPLDNYTETLSNNLISRRFIYGFNFFEQIGCGVRNLLALCSLAKDGEREVVAPYVKDSRMYGFGALSDSSPLQLYFDLEQVNTKLKSNGYSTLTSFADMAENCNRRFDVVVYFLFQDISIERDSLKYQITKPELQDAILRTKQNHGWTNCTFIKNSKIMKQLIGFSASRYVCVDPEIIRTWEKFEEKVLQGANCVGILLWKGIGPKRSQFVLSNTSVLRQSDLQHNAHLIDFARKFVETSGLGKSYISVHVRVERHITRRPMHVTRGCFHQLASTVQKLNKKNNWNVYLACDLEDDGSDIIGKFINKTKKQGLYLELKSALQNPVTSSLIEGVNDRGAKAIIEMHVLALGRQFVTLGGGTFQRWIIELFSQNNRNLEQSLHRVCVIDSK